jgi:dTDP-4-dehydrorhamnose reductase
MSGTEKRVLLLGATGTLGGYLARVLPHRFQTYAPYQGGFQQAQVGIEILSTPLDARRPASLRRLLQDSGAHAVVNCIATTPKSRRAPDAIGYIVVNSMFPHYLMKAADEFGCYVIHLSTDGVFSGKKGCYREDDLPDPPDVYGRSKLLGEIQGERALTLRTSFFGVSPRGGGVVDWLMGERGKTVKGFRNYVFSGVSLALLARVITFLLERSDPLTGLYHFGGPALNKFELLVMLSKALDLDVAVEPADTPVVDRSLDSNELRKIMGLDVPSIEQMVLDVAKDLKVFGEDLRMDRRLTRVQR